jgi:hypothetical protein
VSAVKGDVGKLTAYAKKISKSPTRVAEAAAVAAGTISELVDAQVSSGEDPYGGSWNGATSERIAAIEARTSVTGRGAKIVVRYRQIRRPKRKPPAPPWVIVPKDQRGIPRDWQAAIDTALADAFGDVGAE